MTGGLGLEACYEISRHLLERDWWAKMEFTINGDATNHSYRNSKSGWMGKGGIIR
ncbi:tektin family protein [Bacillus cereus]|nr:tektin family protein [Bacillus cereus]